MTLQRAMETAMGVATDGGVSSETESFSEVRGIPGGNRASLAGNDHTMSGREMA